MITTETIRLHICMVRYDVLQNFWRRREDAYEGENQPKSDDINCLRKYYVVLLLGYHLKSKSRQEILFFELNSTSWTRTDQLHHDRISLHASERPRGGVRTKRSGDSPEQGPAWRLVVPGYIRSVERVRERDVPHFDRACVAFKREELILQVTAAREEAAKGAFREAAYREIELHQRYVLFR